MISVIAFHNFYLVCNISKILNNIFKVPEIPKKPVPEEKKPVPVPQKKEAPPAKGIITIHNVGLNLHINHSLSSEFTTLCVALYC